MGSFDIRSKKRIQLWKKALLHFSLCFVTGFFSGFAPTSSALYPNTIPTPKVESIEPLQNTIEPATVNRSLRDDSSSSATTRPTATVPFDPNDDSAESNPRGLLIVVTTTRSDDEFKAASLTRLAHTLRLVPPPLLWIVVETIFEAPRTAEMLRRTGIMYRHLTFKENFTDPNAEADHQRNVALNHIEHHRLTGIVHFAGLSNVYDLQFFEEIREIEVFGTWPVAMVSANRKRVVVEGPICRSSKVLGWFTKDITDGTPRALTSVTETDVSSGVIGSKPQKINISGFAFNSSVLWDPERWGRPTSLPDTSQDSIKFVQEVVLEDEAKLKGIPSDCSQIMLWHLHIPRSTQPAIF
ncbi:probable beta-1,4-xylosyltransferase GT43A [Typha angustifolia]|uniref:probable beta-1,4-xylosyltransferase GT43A n=1 Tax=Typha angustifolia TaxID=59011 RepID=UPI003C2BFCDB